MAELVVERGVLTQVRLGLVPVATAPFDHREDPEDVGLLSRLVASPVSVAELEQQLPRRIEIDDPHQLHGDVVGRSEVAWPVRKRALETERLLCLLSREAVSGPELPARLLDEGLREE